MRENTIWMSTVLQRALEQGREVRMTTADGTRGFHVEVDGERLTDTPSGDGMAWESFEYPMNGHRATVTEESEDLAREIMLSDPNARCPECYGPRTFYSVDTPEHPRTVVVHCWKCHRSIRALAGGGSDE